MDKPRELKMVGFRVSDPEYWELLSRSLHNAKDLLWKRLQHGEYKDDNEARAVMDAYWSLKKVVEIQEKKIRQLPLPEKKGEELPPTPLEQLRRRRTDDTTP